MKSTSAITIFLFIFVAQALTSFSTMQVVASSTHFEQDILRIRQEQKAFFATGQTRSLSFRREMLQKLAAAVKAFEQPILGALYQDMRRNTFDAYGAESGLVLSDIEHHLKHLKKWARPQRVGTPLFHFKASSYIHKDPYGQVLIIAPWNYPVLLALQPLVGAIAAGNTIVIKPSEISVHTSKVIAELIRSTFPQSYIAVVEGGIEPTQALLAEKWDYIFFTGSTQIGKIVYQAAAQHLTPVTLELGGKSPAIVDESAKLDYAAKRILWGKFLNCGQTCVATDYILVQENIKAQFIVEMKKVLQEFYGENPQNNPKYARIVSDRHFQRLLKLIDTEKVIYGGQTDAKDRYIAPTLMEIDSWDTPCMQEEIFGPILPILTYRHIDEALSTINSRPKPLALYLFSENSAQVEKVLTTTSSGGGCVNDTVMQLASHELPFSTVGDSGIGNYHGKYSFDTFSHQKSVLHKSTLLDLPIRYPNWDVPLVWLKRIFKWTM